MIIQVRGTSGSGKTHAVRSLMDRFERQALYEYAGKRPIGYRLSNGLYIVGRYETPCGGCDTIKTQDEVGERVRNFASQGNVLFEGLLASDNVQRYIDLANSLTNHQFVFAFLDTPLERCLENVLARRAERGEEREFNPENTKARFESILRAKKRLQDAGMDVRDLPQESAADMILAWLPTPTATAPAPALYDTPQQSSLF